VSVANTQDWAHFMKYQLQQMDEMIDNALNHAAVFTWGYFNEGPSDHTEACPAYAACGQLCARRDPTRFTTWADDQKIKGACYEHATLISFNDYPGCATHPPFAPPCPLSLICLVRAPCSFTAGGTTYPATRARQNCGTHLPPPSSKARQRAALEAPWGSPC
jgi:hypothetical protein